jgi:hypothetical protein
MKGYDFIMMISCGVLVHVAPPSQYCTCPFVLLFPQALLPNALSSVLLLVDKETTIKPERDITTVQVKY